MTRKTIINRTGSSPKKIHGYTISFSDSIKTYHIHNYDSTNPKENQETVNARLKKTLNELIDDGEI